MRRSMSLRHPLYATLTAAMLLPFVAFESSAGARRRCSMRISPGYHARAETILLATGLSDTVLAGPGQVAVSGQSGHSGSGRPGPIHGQRFLVHRLAGPDSQRLARALERHGGSGVIVPWDYDAGCAPTRWARPTAWVPVGQPGTFTVSLRAESLWVNGVPVFDAFVASYEPYPMSRVYQRSHPLAVEFLTDPQLTAEQYFDMTSAMPAQEDVWENPNDAWRRFLAWRDANPELARLYPANQAAAQLGSDVRYRKEIMLRRRIEPVMGGTWRMTVSLDDGAERQFHLRTYPGLDGIWTPPPLKPYARPADPLEDSPVPEGYLVRTVGSDSLETLRTGCRTEHLPVREGFMHIIDPRDGASPRREWRGWIDEATIARQFPEDSAFARVVRAVRAGQLLQPDAPDPMPPARFWLDDGGTMHVEQTITLKDGSTLVLRGERISSTTIDCQF